MKTKPMILRTLAAALVAATFVGGLAVASTAQAQQAFKTPEAAADALVDGLARNDDAQVKTVLGPDFRRYIPGWRPLPPTTGRTSSKHGRAGTRS